MTNDDTDLKYWVALGRIPRIGRARFSLLEKHFGRLENAWTASAAELRAAGLDRRPSPPSSPRGRRCRPTANSTACDAPTSTP